MSNQTDVAPQSAVAQLDDATLAKQHSQALQDSQERFQRMVDAVDTPLWTASPDGTVTWSSKRWTEYAGDIQWTDAIHPTERKETLAAWSQSVAEQKPFRHRTRLLSESGTDRWMLVQAVPYSDEWYGSITDIQEHKDVEDVLNRQLRKIQAIYRVSNRVANTNDIEEIIEAALEGLMVAVRADRASVLLYDPDGVMRFKGWRNLSESYRNAVEGHTPWKQDDRDAKPITIRDVFEEKDLEAYRETFTVEGIRSLAFIPLNSENGVLGKFMVYYNEPHTFTESQVQTCMTIAGHIGYAIQKARSHRALNESEELFRVMADSSPALVWINGHNGTEYVNKTYLEFVGCKLEDVRNFDWTKYIHPNDHDEYLRAYLEAYGQRKPYSAQFRLLRNDDTYRWTKTTGVPRFTEDGEFLGFVGSTFDITDIKEKEEALRESEERFRLATASGLVGVWDWDVKNNVVKWSDTTYYIHGVSRDSFGGTVEAFRELVHPDDREMLEKAIKRSLEQNEPYEHEFRVVQPRGKTVWLYTHARVIRDKNDEPIRMLGGTLDITERKTAELALRNSEARAHELSGKLRALLNTTSRMIETLETEQMLEKVLDMAKDIVDADAFGVWRLGVDGAWELVASNGLSKEFLDESLDATRYAKLPEEPIVVQPSDMLERKNDVLRARWSRYDREGIQSLMIQPLRIHGDLGGTLVFYCRTPHEFSDIEIESATAMANIAASAITIAELYEAHQSVS